MADLSQLFVTHKPTPSAQLLNKAFASQQAPPVKNLFGTKTIPTQQPQQKPSLQTSSVFATPLRRT